MEVSQGAHVSKTPGGYEVFYFPNATCPFLSSVTFENAGSVGLVWKSKFNKSRMLELLPNQGYIGPGQNFEMTVSNVVPFQHTKGFQFVMEVCESQNEVADDNIDKFWRNLKKSEPSTIINMDFAVMKQRYKLFESHKMILEKIVEKGASDVMTPVEKSIDMLETEMRKMTGSPALTRGTISALISLFSMIPEDLDIKDKRTFSNLLSGKPVSAKVLNGVSTILNEKINNRTLKQWHMYPTAKGHVNELVHVIPKSGTSFRFLDREGIVYVAGSNRRHLKQLDGIRLINGRSIKSKEEAIEILDSKPLMRTGHEILVCRPITLSAKDSAKKLLKLD